MLKIKVKVIGGLTRLHDEANMKQMY